MIAVIGATGYIGRYLCPYLKSKGYDVLALGRSPKAASFLSEHNVRFEYFDIDSSDSFRTLDKYEISAIVYLSACLAEIETPVEDFFKVNTIGVYKMLDYAHRRDIRRFVMTSSHKVYNDVNKQFISETDEISFRGDHSPYIISKIAAENFMTYYEKDFGICGITLRLTGVRGYGEILGHLDKDGTYRKSALELFFESALEGREICVWGDSSVVRDHVYIKDVIRAISCALEASGNVSGIFNIASGIGHSQYDEAQAMVKVFGDGDLSKIVCCREKPGLARAYVYDISKAERLLGWKPLYSDLVEMYSDYKTEWISKEYKNYHFFIPGQAPLTQ